MDPRLKKRMVPPGLGVMGNVLGSMGKGALSGMEEAQTGPTAGPMIEAALGPAMRTVTPSPADKMRFMQAGANHGVALAGGAAKGALGALVRPDGAIKRTAGGVSGSLKRYIPK